MKQEKFSLSSNIVDATGILLFQSYSALQAFSSDNPYSTFSARYTDRFAIAEEMTLYLVTGLELEGPTCGTLYRRRYDVEFDIRDFKVTLDAENIRAKSVEMFQKELYASVVAYNLVAQFRRQAAQLGRDMLRKFGAEH